MPEWLSIFLSPDLWESLTGPLWLTGNALFWSLALHALLSIPIAFWLARRQNVLTKLVGFVTTLPLIFPPIALGYLLMVLLGQNGWIGGWLKAEWGIRVLFTPEAVILAAFVAGIPLVVRPLKAAFSDAKLRDLEAAASLCGLSPLKRFLLITVPLVRKPLAAAFILAAGRAIGEVGITMMLGGNIEDRTATVSLEIFNAVGRGDFDEATALCGVLAAISLCFYVRAIRPEALQSSGVSAESLGLGAVYIGALRDEETALCDLLHLPEQSFVVAGLLVGWPAEGVQTLVRSRPPAERRGV